MMSKITQQFCLTEHNFRWLLEEKIGRHHKNLSETINELLKNYQYMVRSIERTQKQIEIEQKRQKEADDMVKSYRQQVKVQNEMVENCKEIVKNDKSRKDRKNS